MQYRTVGKTGIVVSNVALGTWAIGGKNWGGDIDDNVSIACIHRALDEGINLIDTAPVYGSGHAETVVGRALCNGKRRAAVISTKCGLLIDQGNTRSLRPDSIRKEADASLSRLKTDVIDIYFCHWPDKNTPIEDTVGELVRLVETGKIRGFGLSNHESELVKRACAAGPAACLQEHYSLLRRDIETGLLGLCDENGLGLFAYAPFGGGILTGKYDSPPIFKKGDVRSFFYPFYSEPLWGRTQMLLAGMRDIAEKHGVPIAHIAIAWLTRQHGVTSALVGAKSPEQVVSNAAAGNLALNPADLLHLSELSKRIEEPSP